MKRLMIGGPQNIAAFDVEDDVREVALPSMSGKKRWRWNANPYYMGVDVYERDRLPSGRVIYVYSHHSYPRI